jgi:hypothetical protein
MAGVESAEDNSKQRRLRAPQTEEETRLIMEIAVPKCTEHKNCWAAVYLKLE